MSLALVLKTNGEPIEVVTARHDQIERDSSPYPSISGFSLLLLARIHGRQPEKWIWSEWRLHSKQVIYFSILRRVNKNEAGKAPFSYFILVLFTIHRVVLTVKFVAFNPKKFAELVRFLQVVLHWETKILFWLSGWYGCKTNDQLKETIQLMFFYIFTLHFGLS